MKNISILFFWNPKRFRVGLFLVALLAVSLVATAETTDIAEKKRATLDVLIGFSGEADLSSIPGLVLRSRIGNVASATVTPAAMEAVAENQAVRYIEPAVRLQRFNDIATAASSAFFGHYRGRNPRHPSL